jgi:hypothetical protein
MSAVVISLFALVAATLVGIWTGDWRWAQSSAVILATSLLFAAGAAMCLKDEEAQTK